MKRKTAIAIATTMLFVALAFMLKHANANEPNQSSSLTNECLNAVRAREVFQYTMPDGFSRFAVTEMHCHEIPDGANKENKNAPAIPTQIQI